MTTHDNDNDNDDRPLLSTFDTATYLGVPRQTLATWRSHATGPAYIRIGRHIKYRLQTLDTWVVANTVTPKEQP